MSLPVPQQLRIAVFNRTFSPTGGGAERYSIALVEQLSARHEVHVFAQVIDHQWPGVIYHQVSAPLRKPHGACMARRRNGPSRSPPVSMPTSGPSSASSTRHTSLTTRAAAVANS